MSRPAAALLLVAALGGGCVTTPPTVGEPAPRLPDDQQEADYRATLARYSDHAEVYAGFDTRLFAAATFQSPAFREARVRRLATFHVLPEVQLQALLAEERAAAQAAHEFALGVHLNEARFDDLDRRGSVWRIALLRPGLEVLPARVERVGRADLNLRALYPYLGTFWTLYRVRFPTQLPDGTPVLPPAVGEVTLRVTSTLGRADLQMPVR